LGDSHLLALETNVFSHSAKYLISAFTPKKVSRLASGSVILENPVLMGFTNTMSATSKMEYGLVLIP
jgi:hypothetical protein